jgi:glycerol-3-phosphate O-acyltransferase
MAAPVTDPPLRTATPEAPVLGGPEASARLAEAYGGFLRWVFRWAFLPVRVPPGASAELRSLSERGTVVYVGRSAALVTFLYFQQLFVRLGAPVAQAVQGLGVPIWSFWGRLIAGRAMVRAPDGDDVVRAVRARRSAMVFLRKPGSLAAQILPTSDPFPALVAAQREIDRPIYLLPQLLIWERRPRHFRRTLFDVIFGEVETPGFFRSLFALVWNRQRAFVKFGEPIDLRKVVNDFAGVDDRTIARKVRGSLNQHLARETRVVTGPPLKDPDRLIQETLRERGLRATLAEVARERGRADGSVEKEAEKDLREIAARYSPQMIDFMRWALDYVFNRIYDGIDYDEEGLRRIAATATRAPIIVCPGHKSHIDYLILSYVFYVSGLMVPHIAAGINLDFPPIGSIFRRSGAFFIRRSFKDDRVYSAVLKAYARKLLREGFTQEFFVEGSRSRTGKVLMPKFGLLAMEVDAWLDDVRPDVAFVPASIAYERIIEGKAYARELAGAEKKAEDLGQLLQARKVLTTRYGRIHIRFDHPISIAELAAQRGVDRKACTEEQKRGLVRALGFRIVEGVNRATLLTPSALLCSALLATDRKSLTASEVVTRMEFLLKLAVDDGAELTFENEPGALDPLGSGALHEAFVAFEKEKAIVVQRTANEPTLSVPDAHRVPLDYYKNSSLHHYVADALLATCLLSSDDYERGSVERRTLALSRHLKQEFIYGAGGFPALFRKRVDRFVNLGLVREEKGRLVPVVNGANWRIRMLADLLVNFVESYQAANEVLTLLLRGPMDRRELVKQAMDRVQAAVDAGRLRRRESVSRVTLENALDLFEEQGVLVRRGEKGRQRGLSPGHDTQEAIDARVAELRSFLIPKEA